MNPSDPILDQPQDIDYDAIDPAATYRLANHDIVFDVNATTDVQNLVWPWADATYLRSLTMRVRDPQLEELAPMITRYYPGYQETILGSEGMIISKQVAAPLGSAYDRGILWMLDCQAEGDRLIRIDIEIDWGEPLTQRMVDGLLVAQRNPGQARGIYSQHNAESTRVFGNPHGRPSGLRLHDDGRAELTYFVLVNGMVEVPLLLTISDVGEQVAWNGFLGLRDVERAFELSVEAWEKAVKRGRLWTSDPELNRAVQGGRLTALRHLQRLRSGFAPTDRAIHRVPLLVKALDAYDPVLSRNLLAHVRRVAERSEGNLPEHLPIRPKDALEAPGPRLAWNNRAYLQALTEHLARHPNPDLLAEHYAAVTACAETLIKVRMEAERGADAATLQCASAGLRHAVTLAGRHHDSVNAIRWESEACELERMVDGATLPAAPPPLQIAQWAGQVGWKLSEDRPWDFKDPWLGIVMAGEAVWGPYGLQRRRQGLAVYPTRGNKWSWWALLDLPVDDGSISLVWDGTTLHTTQPLQSDKPVAVYENIRATNTDELEFDLTFVMTPSQEADGREARRTFRPTFAGDAEPS